MKVIVIIGIICLILVVMTIVSYWVGESIFCDQYSINDRHESEIEDFTLTEHDKIQAEIDAYQAEFDKLLGMPYKKWDNKK